MLEHIVSALTLTPFRVIHSIPDSENCTCVFDNVEIRRRCMYAHPSMAGDESK